MHTAQILPKIFNHHLENLIKPMRNFEKVINGFALFWLPIFYFGCGDSSQPSTEITGEDIVGDPILGHQDLENLSSSDDSNLSTHLHQNESNASEVTEVLEQGIVVDGRPITKDANISEPAIVSNLPPLEEGSEYKPLAFRDLTNFEYLVDWEKDGKEFDFTAYAQRVPKTLREISGNKIAIEGFMIPTVVDENNEVKEFLLLPDQMSCCFGQTPEANGWVVVNAELGVEVMMDRIIRVTGELTVEERWDEEFFVGLYHMTCHEITGPAL